jgi:hypothetical protein
MWRSTVPVTKVIPESDLSTFLPKAVFSDAYRLIIDEAQVDALTAARRVMGRTPAWIRGLMSLRNRITALFGLKPARLALQERQDKFAVVESFPVICHAPERVVLGFDDKHLDFRIIIDVASIGTLRSQITTTTLVCPHNLLGRIYLAFVLPFHRVIVPVMLAKAA